MGFDCHSYSYFRQFVLGRIVSFNQLSCGMFVYALPATTALIAEVALLGWPNAWIYRSILSVPRKHFSEFMQILKLTVKAMVRAKISDLSYDRLVRIFTSISDQIGLGGRPSLF
jgi:hypothetical protein